MLKSIRKNLYSKSGFQYFLILLFIGAFTCLRSFDLVALQPPNPDSEQNARKSFQHFNEGDNFIQSVLAEIPVDQELEEAEEKDDSEHSFTTSAEEKLASSDLDPLSRCLKIRFRQQRFSLSQLSPVPFFILYHSWKSFLS